MAKGSLLETCPYRKKRGDVPVVFSFGSKDAEPATGSLPEGSVVTSLGTLGPASDPNDLGRKGTFLKVISSSGVTWIRVRNLRQHRPGVQVDESRVKERPRRASDELARKERARQRRAEKKRQRQAVKAGRT